MRPAINYFLNFLFLAVCFLPLDTVNVSGETWTLSKCGPGTAQAMGTPCHNALLDTPRETNIHGHEAEPGQSEPTELAWSYGELRVPICVGQRNDAIMLRRHGEAKGKETKSLVR